MILKADSRVLVICSIFPKTLSIINGHRSVAEVQIDDRVAWISEA
jgi:hypothetical protein